MCKLIVLDRDGVINEDSPAYVKRLSEWHPLPGSIEAIARLSRGGYRIGIATNQSGIARGLIAAADLQAIHARLIERVHAAGGRIDCIRFCPHGPDDGCRCRKPAPGLVLDLLEALAVAPEEAVMVGDSLRDIQAARAAGIRAVLVRTGNGAGLEAQAHAAGADAVFDDLAAFAEHLLTTGRT